MRVPFQDRLVRSASRWQERPVPRSSTPQPRAAGAFIALCVIAGAVVGVILGQPSAGVVGGAVLGVAIAIVQWLGDRRR